MPELPEVETLATDLRRLLTGAEFKSVEVLWPRSVAMPTAEELVRQLPGHQIRDVSRRGKFLVLSLSGCSALLIHLRMSGQVRVEPATAPVDSHARVIFYLVDGRRMLFSDPRKFGRIYWTADAHCVLGDLGPEPLDDDFTARDFWTRLSAHKGALKPLLLNQTVLAGLGNIYADEALFAAGLHPLRKANTLSVAEGERLYHAIREVLQQAICHRGTTLDDERYQDAEGQPGEHAPHLRVYRRAGQPCLRCGTPIQRTVVGTRGTYFCPRCQH